MTASAFYIVVLCWMVTMTVWQYREKQNAVERMEMLKLFRAQSLSDYNAQKSQLPQPSNFINRGMQKAYDHLLGDDE